MKTDSWFQTLILKNSGNWVLYRPLQNLSVLWNIRGDDVVAWFCVCKVPEGFLGRTRSEPEPVSGWLKSGDSDQSWFWGHVLVLWVMGLVVWFWGHVTVPESRFGVLLLVFWFKSRSWLKFRCSGPDPGVLVQVASAACLANRLAVSLA